MEQIIIMRTETEQLEVVITGVVKRVGMESEHILVETRCLLDDQVPGLPSASR